MSTSIAYTDFVDYRAKLNLAMDDIKNDRKSAASNRMRAVKKHLDELETQRNDLNCESLGRLNYLQKLHQEIEDNK